MLNYAKIYYMSAILGGKSMNKWEEEYNKIKPNIDKMIKEQNNKINDIRRKQATIGKEVKSEDYKNLKDDLKDAQKEKIRLEKLKPNLRKIENVIQYRNSLKKELEELKKELDANKRLLEANEKREKAEKEIASCQENYEKISKELRNNKLEQKDRLKLEKDRAKITQKMAKSQKIMKNQEDILMNGLKDKAGLSKEEIEDKASDIQNRISKCNLVANNLLNGLSWDEIDKKLDNWKDKRFTCKDGKLSRKTEENKETEQNKETEELFENLFPETEENSNEYDIISDSNAEAYNINKRLMFEKKHPMLAKIQNWFKKVFGNEEKMLQEGKVEEKVEEEVEEKVEEKVEEEVEEKVKEEVKDISFREYIKVVAEKGMDGVEKDRQQNAKERLAKFREEKGYRQGDTGGTMTQEGRNALNKIDKTVQEIDDESR